MSKHLLKKLLGFESENDSVTKSESEQSENDQTTTDQKYAMYYSTDKKRNVLTRIPKKMRITSTIPSDSDYFSNGYTDDLSDVSSVLLNRLLKQNENYSDTQTQRKPDTKNVVYYSTDKGKYLESSVPSKVKIIKNLSELNTDYTLSNLYSEIKPESESDFNSIYSNNFSNKSSYTSNKDTSYDSFYDDILGNYENENNTDKINTIDKMISSHNLDELYSLSSEMDSKKPKKESFNVFKSSHRIGIV
jgi:hypothetical protein